jgi:hypothetical protein
VDFVSAHSLRELVTGMDKLPDVVPLDYATVEAEVTARDREVANRFSKDGQITAIRAARGYQGDRVGRVVAPHRLTDPKAGPLIAVKLHILTRKTWAASKLTYKLGYSKPTARRLPGCTRLARWRGSAGAACMVTEPWRAPSWVAASSPVGPPAAAPPTTSPSHSRAPRQRDARG